MSNIREAMIARTTRETKIDLAFRLDGSGQRKIQTGIGFFDHCLEAFTFHGSFDLELSCQGDLHVDGHHTIEDVGLVLGLAFRQALGDALGIKRFSSTITPMDESLVLVALDVSGRSYLVENLGFISERLGQMETQNIREFLCALTNSAGITLHVDLLRGENDHHKAEALFKGLGRAMQEACVVVDNKVASTKGVL